MLQHSRGDGESAAANAREDAVVLTRIRTVQVRDATTLLHTLSDLEEKLAEASTPRNPASFFRNLKLVVIDSLGSLFACVIGGRQSVGHALLVSVSTLIQRIMTQYHIAFVVTNHTTEYQGKVSPALGDTWTHMPCVSMVLTRPDLKASDSSARRATIRKSNKNDTLAAADFSVGVVGVADPVCEVSTSEESR
ncbi:hypothetical protein T484DRAFT_2628703 [Baffinella frigidus]|nr:hypothetical protein T484DRAFT_2628703 [Cryptophyta sp. CCMP2293]